MEPVDEVLSELKALRAQLATLTKRELGFHDFEPRARFIYVKHDPGLGLWYFWDHESSTKETISHNALTGYITNLSVYDKLDRDGLKPKLQLNLEADARYVLQCGLETTFANGLLQSLAALTPADLACPVTIQVSGNDISANRPVVFCTLYQDGKRVWFEDSGRDNAVLVQELRKRFNFPEPRSDGSLAREDGDVDESADEPQARAPATPTAPVDDPEELPWGTELDWDVPKTAEATLRDLGELKSEVAQVAKRLERITPEQRRDFFAWVSVVKEPYSPATGARAQRDAPKGPVKDFDAKQFEALLANLGSFEGEGFLFDEIALRTWERRFETLR